LANRDHVDSLFDGPEAGKVAPPQHVIDANDPDGKVRPRATRKSNLHALRDMMRDPKAEWLAKAIGLAAVLYLFSPIDFIPDLLVPGLGLTDDLVAVLTAMATLFSAVQRHRGEASGPDPAGSEAGAVAEPRRSSSAWWTIGALVFAIAAIGGLWWYSQG
jgi:uncharacterized membrane protein YkvA (DUF1232 family)